MGCDNGVSWIVARCCAGRSRRNCGRYVKKETTTFIKISGRGSIEPTYFFAFYARSFLSLFILRFFKTLPSNFQLPNFLYVLLNFGTSKFIIIDPRQVQTFKVIIRGIVSRMW